jgi:nucleotide-binding universal stress UspA family protein
MPPDRIEVCVLHIIEPVLVPDYGGGKQIEAEEQWRQERGKELVTRSEQLLAKEGFKVTTVIQEGDARLGIVDYAGQWKADLIVVGSHGRKGLDRLLLGRVAESVARHADCSVLIVRIPASS